MFLSKERQVYNAQSVKCIRAAALRVWANVCQQSCGRPYLYRLHTDTSHGRITTSQEKQMQAINHDT